MKVSSLIRGVNNPSKKKKYYWETKILRKNTTPIQNLKEKLHQKILFVVSYNTIYTPVLFKVWLKNYL